MARRIGGRRQTGTAKMRFLNHDKEATVFWLRNEASEQLAIRTYPDNIPLLTGWCLFRQQGHSSTETRLVHYVGREDRPALRPGV